jgi:hypothetical protein
MTLGGMCPLMLPIPQKHRAPCEGTVFQRVRIPPGKLSLQPVAIGAAAQGGAAEAFGVKSHVGDTASMQAVMRVNAEQASKRGMRKPTRRYFGEGCYLWRSER